MLILSDKDIERIAQTDELVYAIERAYSLQDKASTNIPERLHLTNGPNTLLVMPGIINEVIGTKLVCVNPGNPKLGKPAINGVMILQNITTGEPTAMLNGSKITAIRTGAVGATAVKYLAPLKSKCLGIIGSGIQAYYQALMISEQRAFSKIVLFNRNKDKAVALKAKLSIKLKMISIEIADNPEEVVRIADVVVTTTSSKTPIFEINDVLIKQKTFIGIGSYKPEMQEIPLELFKNKGSVFVDTMHAAEESGDLLIPIKKGILNPKDIIPFNTIISGKNTHLISSVNIFKSVGSSLFDLTVAEIIYNNAIELGVGTTFDL